LNGEIHMRYSILFTAVILVAELAHHVAFADSGPTQAELNAAGQSTEWLLPKEGLQKRSANDGHVRQAGVNRGRV
jgi:hypothetical protein